MASRREKARGSGWPGRLRWWIGGLLAGLAVAASGCGEESEASPAARTDSVTVFAAASTTDAMSEVAATYETRTGGKVRLNFASSGTLARQIEAGAPADVLLSANPKWMDYLQERGRLAEGSRVDLLANRLVWIAPRGEGMTLRFERSFALADAFGGRFAVGDPAHVPAGRYAMEAMASLGWWDALAGRAVMTADVRAALALVARGEARAGVVYATDARVSPDVTVVGTFPESTHAPIRYPVARLSGAGDGAERFVAFLRSPEASAVFQRHGFEPLATVEPAPASVPADPSWWGSAGPAVWLSVKVAATSVGALLVPGVLLGYVLARGRFRGKALLDGLVHTPMVVPPVVTGYLLLVLLGTRGPVGGWLWETFGVRLAFDWKGAVVASAVVALPLMVRSVRVAMELADTGAEQAAATLGAGPVRRFLTVTVPLAGPGILGGAITAFARSLGEFGATMTFVGNLAGETRTLPLAVYSQIQVPGGEETAMKLAGVSVGLAVLAMVGSELLVRRMARRMGRAVA